jgi:hypothetical protein
MQQQQRSSGADGQLQRTVWDPGGFQQPCWEAHEQELMIFAAEEYDAGASLQVINTSQPAHQARIQWRGEAQPSHFQISNLNLMY